VTGSSAGRLSDLPVVPPMVMDERLPWAVSWTQQEPMERSSHALAAGDRVWLVDPVADDEALAAAERLGQVVAVLQLLDRHPRDCEALAERYGVPHVRLPEALEDTPFSAHRIVWVPRWREIGLWWEEHRTLVVPEAVGTAEYFAVGGRRLGMHPMLRPKPPSALSDFTPEHLLVGHGPPLHENAAEALSEALDRSLKDAPKAAAAMAKAFGPGGVKDGIDAFKASG